jgi:hypothetical protein
MMHWIPGTRGRSRLIARASTWKPFSYWTRPHVKTSEVRAPRPLPVDHHVGSMPLGMRWLCSAGSSNPPTTSLTMNFELATTAAASWASHDSMAWIVLASPGGTRPP